MPRPPPRATVMREITDAKLWPGKLVTQRELLL